MHLIHPADNVETGSHRLRNCPPTRLANSKTHRFSPRPRNRLFAGSRSTPCPGAKRPSAVSSPCAKSNLFSPPARPRRSGKIASASTRSSRFSLHISLFGSTTINAGSSLSFPGVLRIIGSTHAPRPIPDCEIKFLQSRSGSSHLEPWLEIPTGKRVRISSGPMQGIRESSSRREAASASCSPSPRSISTWLSH